MTFEIGKYEIGKCKFLILFAIISEEYSRNEVSLFCIQVLPWTSRYLVLCSGFLNYSRDSKHGRQEGLRTQHLLLPA